MALAVGIVALGATVQRALGFGAAMVSVPLLLLVDPRLVPGPVTVAGIALVALMQVGTGRDTDWAGVRWMVLGLVPGTVVAGFALVVLPATALAVAAGVLVLAGVGAVAAERSVVVRRRSLLGSGALSGFMGTAAGIGGPPIALLYSGAHGAVLRATLARVFMASAVLTVATLAWAHRLAAPDWAVGVAMMPGGLLGFAAGGRLAPHLDGDRLRGAVLVVSAASALAAIARAVA